jgi:hypothetical protein
VAPLFNDAFKQGKGADPRIIAILNDHWDLRHMMQQAEFTVHGSKTPIDELPETDTFLAKITIPTNRRLGLQQTLDLLGVSRSTLFPDLENLALELCSTEFCE